MTITRILDAPPARVVEVACDFRTLHEWHPGYGAATLEEDDDGGLVRVLEMGGSFVRERLIEASEDRRGYAYRIESHPMPIREAHGMIRVDPSERPFESVIRWSVTFAPASDRVPEAMLGKMLEAVMRMGLEALAARFDGEPVPAAGWWGQSGETTLPGEPPPMETDE